MNLDSKIQFKENHNLLTLIKEESNLLLYRDSSKIQALRISKIDVVTQFSSISMDVEGAKILDKVSSAFSTLYILPEFRIRKKDESAEYVPGICTINWNIYSEEYTNYKGKSSDLQKVKDFLRVSALYYDRIVEIFDEEHKKDGLKLLIHPIVDIKDRPAFTTMTETTKYMEKFVVHSNVAPLQVVFQSRDKDFVGLVAIKSGISIAKLIYKVSGIRLHRNLRSAVSYILKNMEKGFGGDSEDSYND